MPLRLMSRPGRVAVIHPTRQGVATAGDTFCTCLIEQTTANGHVFKSQQSDDPVSSQGGIASLDATMLAMPLVAATAVGLANRPAAKLTITRIASTRDRRADSDIVPIIA
jgi:hypothetical protein